MTNRKIILSDDIDMRGLHLNDADLLYDFIKDEYPKLSKWVSFMDDISDAVDAFRLLRIILNIKSIMIFGIFYKDKIIGLIQLHEYKPSTKKGELAYMLSKSHQGKAIVHASIKSLVSSLFTEGKLNRVYVRVFKDNRPGRRVAQRLGFKYEGIERQGELLRGKYYDMQVYSLLKDDCEKTLTLNKEDDMP